MSVIKEIILVKEGPPDYFTFTFETMDGRDYVASLYSELYYYLSSDSPEFIVFSRDRVRDLLTFILSIPDQFVVRLLFKLIGYEYLLIPTILS